MAIDQELRDAWKAHVDEVRARARIEDVIGPLDKQKHVGRGSVIGCSPLRVDRSPSFLVNTEKGFWKDFGTGDQGDVFGFVMARDGVSFRQAVDTLAASVNLVWSPGGAHARWSDDEWGKIAAGMIERNRILDVQTTIVEAMHAALPRRVREYIRENWHFTDATVDRFKFGWCIEGLADLLMLPATEGGYGLTEKDLMRSGFFVMTKAGPKPIFSHRIVFPYWRGPHAVYAIGRRYDPVPASEIEHEADYEKAKYKKLLAHDARERPYVSEWILNEHFLNEEVVLKAAIDYLIITEGITDCYALVQIGMNAMSPVTVGFRDQDLPKLIALCKRVRGPIYLMNDNDVLSDGRRPGYEGAMRTAKALSREGINVRIAWLPKPEGATKIDVNEYVGEILDDAKSRGLEEDAANDEARVAIRALMLNAKDFGEALFDALPATLAGVDLDKHVGELAAAVAHTHELAREGLAAKVAKRFKMPRALVRGVFKKAAEVHEAEAAKAKAAEPVTLMTAEGELLPRGHVFEAPDHYFTKVRIAQGDGTVERDQPVSDFRLVCRRVLIPPIEGTQELLDVDIVGMGGVARGRYVLPPKAWNSARAFRDLRPTADIEWLGNDNELAHVQHLLFREEGVPRVRCTRVLGFHETAGGPRWVTPQGTIGPHGWMSAPDIVFVDEHHANALAAKMCFEDVDETLVHSVAAEALPKLLEVAAPEVVLPLLGHLYASFFASRLRLAPGRSGAFPLLNVAGTAGSGKTTLMRLLWRLQGIAPERSEAIGAKTVFAMGQSLAWTNGTWIFYDEFRQDKDPRAMREFEALARNAYTAESQIRGRADLSTVSTTLLAPWAIVGEVTAAGDDPALRQRFIPVRPSRLWVRSYPESSKAYRKLAALPLHYLAPSFAQWSLGQDVGALVERADVFVAAMLARLGNVDVDARTRNNIAALVLGLQAFDAWAMSLGIELRMNIDAPMRRVIEHAVGADEGGMISEDTAKDSFDAFLEHAAAYAVSGAVEEGVCYTFKNGLLHLALRPTYNAVRAEMTRGGTDRPFTLDYAALVDIAREKATGGNSYVLPSSIEEDSNGKKCSGRRTMIGSVRQRAFVIDLFRVPAHVDAHDFPTTKKATTRDMLASFTRDEIPPPPWGPKTGDG
ncbi:MAG: CHC2 zinc finger domain-containing protein [Ginsengibacter sp.]